MYNRCSSVEEKVEVVMIRASRMAWLLNLGSCVVDGLVSSRLGVQLTRAGIIQPYQNLRDPEPFTAG